MSRAVDTNDPLPLYYQVYESLLNRIQAREFAPGEAIPGLRQLVDDYGVSSITVIKAVDLLQQNGWVRKKQGKGTIVQEQAAMPHGGMVAANLERTGPGSGNGRPLIVFCSNIVMHPYHHQILMGITAVTSQQGYNLQVIDMSEDPMEEQELIRSLLTNGVDGLLLYRSSSFSNQDFFADLSLRQTPMVFLDRYLPGVSADCVLNDDEQGGFALTEALIARGHRAIAVVQHRDAQTTSVRDRVRGYRRALETHGIVWNEELIWLDIYSSFDPLQRWEHRRAALNLLERHVHASQPTAILAINYDTAIRVADDLISLELVAAPGAADQGVRDIAAFSHLPTLAMAPLNFILAVQSGKRVGSEAAQLMVNRLERRIAGPPVTVRIPVEMHTAPQVQPVQGVSVAVS